MRRLIALAFVLCGCGALPSGAGAPSNPPSSGLGPIIPLEDSEGLTWTPPFWLSDFAVDYRHPSLLVDGDAIDLWVEAQTSTEVYVTRNAAPTFEESLAATGTELHAFLPWHAGVIGSPSVVRASDGGVLLFYVAGGQLGLVRYTAAGARVDRATPLYVDPDGGAIRSMAAALADETIRIVLLVEDGTGQRLDEVAIPRADLEAAGDGPVVDLISHAIARPTGVPVPPWATGLLDVGQRISRPAGRLRQDLFFAASLPSTADLGAGRVPSAIGAAARYLDSDGNPPFELVAAPILAGPPPPGSATAVGYRGGVLVLYSAQSGPRTAIGVGRHP